MITVKILWKGKNASWISLAEHPDDLLLTNEILSLSGSYLH